jgi:hypothetical protein
MPKEGKEFKEYKELQEFRSQLSRVGHFGISQKSVFLEFSEVAAS